MPIEVLMPALSPTMTEGNLAKWHKREGEAVSSGDILAEIETDKATMEVEAVDDGVLGRIIVAEGAEGVAVNTPIAILLEDGEDASTLDQTAKKAAPAPPPAASEEPTPVVPTPTNAVATPTPTADAGSGGRVFASPLARRMAKQAGLDLAGVTGSGPHGRIVRHDIDTLLSGAPPVAPGPAPRTQEPSAAALAPDIAGMPAYSEIPHSTVRKVIARRLVESKREAPHFYLTVDCEIDELLKARKELNGRSPESGAGLLQDLSQ